MEDDADRKLLEQHFAAAMKNIYIEAKRDLGYNATYFLQMLSTLGPIATARRLITSSTPSEGFTTLWERRRLDLTVEAHVIQPWFTSLFSEDEIAAARARLTEYGYEPPR